MILTYEYKNERGKKVKEGEDVVVVGKKERDARCLQIVIRKFLSIQDRCDSMPMIN